MEELRRQRDLAQSQVDELRKKIQEEPQVYSLSLSLSLSLSISFWAIL